MFDHMISLLFVITDVCVRANASVRPHISDGVEVHVVVKGDVF